MVWSQIFQDLSNALDGTEDNVIFDPGDSYDDDKEAATIVEGLFPVDISNENDEKLNVFYDE